MVPAPIKFIAEITDYFFQSADYVCQIFKISYDDVHCFRLKLHVFLCKATKRSAPQYITIAILSEGTPFSSKGKFLLILFYDQ